MKNDINFDKQKILDKIDIGKEDIVYIAGSIMEGFGNKKSDIDVYVITNNYPKNKNLSGITVFEDDILVNNFFIDNTRVDVEYWPIEKVANSIESVNNVDIVTTDFFPIIEDNKLEFIHRLKYGVPIYNSKDFSELYKEINYINLSVYLAVKSIEKASGLFEDIQGAILSEDWGTVHFLGKDLIITIMEALMFLNGETNLNRKWMYRKLKRLDKKQNTDFLPKILKYLNKEILEVRNDEFVEETLSTFHELNNLVQKKLQIIQMGEK